MKRLLFFALLAFGCAGEALDQESGGAPIQPYPILDELGEAALPQTAIKTSGSTTIGSQPSTLNKTRCNNSSTTQVCNYVFTGSDSGISEYRIRVSGFTAAETTAVNAQVDNFCMSMAQKINALPSPPATFSCFRVTDGTRNILIQKAQGANGPDEVGTYAGVIYEGCSQVTTESLPGTYNRCAGATINYAIAASESRLTARGFTNGQKANARNEIVFHALLASMITGGQSSNSSFPSHNLISGDTLSGVLDGVETCHWRNITWGSFAGSKTITSTTGC